MYTVVIDAEDTDILCLSSYTTTQIPLPIYVYRHGRLCNLVIKSAKSTDSYISLQVQVVRHHFVIMVNLTLRTTISVIPKLNRLDDNLPIEQHSLQNLEDITMVYIYKVENAKSMGEARAIKHTMF